MRLVRTVNRASFRHGTGLDGVDGDLSGWSCLTVGFMTLLLLLEGRGSVLLKQTTTR
jgi:hypothetical protein